MPFMTWLVLAHALTLSVENRGAASPDLGNEPAARQREALPELLPQRAARRPRQHPNPVSRDWADAFVPGVNIRELPALTAAEIAAADQRAAAEKAVVNPPPPRVGLARSFDPAPITLPGPDALVRQLDDGRRVWTLAIDSPGALELRAQFTDVNLGRSELVLYASHRGRLISHGPYRKGGPERDGDFWSPAVPGERLLIEIVGYDEPHLRIPQIIHVDRESGDGGGIAGDCEPSVCPCHLDVMCQSVNVAARQATGRMRFLEDGDYKVCTGTLMTDLDAGTYAPWFLTAAHCIDTQSVMDTLEIVWSYQKTACDGPVPSDPENEPWMYERSYGGQLLYETGPPALTNDACFARLHGGLPAGTALAGWTTVQDSGVVGIHHPVGSWKRAAFGHFESLSIDCGADCGCFDSAYYAFYDLDDGIIQGGSSGSGMFNASGQLIGQLFGHCTLCPDATDCDHGGDWCLMYGEWEETYPEIEFWMKLGSSIHVDRTNTSAPWNGLPSDPFRYVIDGYNYAIGLGWQDLRLVVHAGNYNETMTLTEPIRIVSQGGTVRIGTP